MFIMYSDCVFLEDFLNHMDYFYDVFMYFLRCEHFRGMDFKQMEFQKSFIKNILICVLNMNKSLMGLEWLAGE